MTQEQFDEALLEAEKLRTGWKISDDLRDEGLKLPGDVKSIRNLLYGPYGHWNLFDIYLPKAQDGKETILPVIVSIHGGGWQYGDKELYRPYCMSLAQRGFAVVSFNYRLAPEDPFPAAFLDVNRIFAWIARNGEHFHLDRNRVFIVGDSAGAQMASWYATLLTSASFRELYASSFPLAGARHQAVPFTKEQYGEAGIAERLWKDIPEDSMVPDERTGFTVPADRLHVRGVALNCGVYDVLTNMVNEVDSYFLHFLGELAEESDSRKLTLKLVDSYGHQTKDFPPAFIMSAANDFLLPCAEPMADHLKALGVKTSLHIYGQKHQLFMGHVFHVNLKLREAAVCNDEECAFFRSLTADGSS